MRRSGFCGFLSVVYLNIAKLLIGYAQYANMSLLGNNALYPFNVHLCILPTSAVTYVYGELEHGETIGHKLFAKSGIDFSFGFSLCWQIE